MAGKLGCCAGHELACEECIELVASRCECGRMKHPNRDACPSCAKLDGARNEYYLIRALKDLGWSNAQNLAIESNRAYESVLRSLQVYMRDGLVRRSDHATEVEGMMYHWVKDRVTLL